MTTKDPAPTISELPELPGANDLRAVSELMRVIDAYAYDYGYQGKVAGSRFAVEQALLADRAARRSTEGWQPIETAPKDGTEMLLSNGETVTLGWWMEHEGGTTEYRDVDGRYLGQRDDDGYIGWWDVGGGMQPEPTFCMPLPAAPKAAEEKGQES